MSLALSEWLQTAGVAVAAFAVLNLLALFLKAESATWKNRPEEPPSA
jgi:hypothetical protein